LLLSRVTGPAGLKGFIVGLALTIIAGQVPKLLALMGSTSPAARAAGRATGATAGGASELASPVQQQRDSERM
jgi:MFS superfamily sulfate permease-like transporter